MSDLDLETMREVAEDCGWSLRELADRYRQQVREGLDRIAAALSAGDAESARRVAHGLVGASATCGATRLAGLFRALESAGGPGDLGSAANLLRDAETGFGEVERRLERESGTA